MKIERLNENQIRCTLNKSDLVSRQLKINELAYGSDKAKELFRDMMQQASYELGFEAEDSPVMIEAIPVSAECIVLIVTKVDNPEELDTRFSRFSPSDIDPDDQFDFDDMETIESDGFSTPSDLPTANEELSSEEAASEEESDISDESLMNIFNRVKDYFNKNLDNTSSDHQVKAKPSASSQQALPSGTDKHPANETSDNSRTSHVRVFSFESLDNICDAARIIDSIYHDTNMLFKKNSDNRYYLVITKESVSAVNFNKICNILSEYGRKEQAGDSYLGYLSEHCDCIIKKHALHILKTL